MEMKEYIEQWNTQTVKPVNEEVFIELFKKFLGTQDIDNFAFEGENFYCGYTAILRYNNYRYFSGDATFLDFEIAYSYKEKFFKVFTLNHNGFWVPEYISVKGSDAVPYLEILKERFIEFGGF